MTHTLTRTPTLICLIVAMTAIVSCAEWKALDAANERAKTALRALEDAKAEYQSAATDEAKAAALVRLEAAQAEARAAGVALDAAADAASTATQRATDTAGGIAAAIPPPYGTLATGIVGLLAVIGQSIVGRKRLTVARTTAENLRWGLETVVSSVEALRAAGLITPTETTKAVMNAVQPKEVRAMVDAAKANLEGGGS